MFRNLAVYPPGPCHRLSPWGTVVLVRGHDCSHRLLLVSPPRAQTALPSPVIAMQRRVDHWSSKKGKRALRAVTLESERMLLLVLLLNGEIILKE